MFKFMKPRRIVLPDGQSVLAKSVVAVSKLPLRTVAGYQIEPALLIHFGANGKLVLSCSFDSEAERDDALRSVNRQLGITAEG